MRWDARVRACLLAAAGLLAPARAAAQGAYQQLEQACRDATGAPCATNVPPVSPPKPVAPPTPRPAQGGQGVQEGEAVRSTRPSSATTRKQVVRPPPPAPRAPPRKTTEQVFREQFATALVGGFLSALLAPPAPTPQAPQGPSPEELAERERQRVAELQARAALVAEQRATRDAQQASNMESMAAAFGAGFDRPAGVADGGSDVVRLSGTTPSLFAPPVYRSPAQAVPPSPSVQRLAALAVEREDVAGLQERYAELSGRLDAALAEADAIGRKSRNRVEEYDRMEQTVARGVADAWDRGMSLAMDGLLLGHAKAIERVEEVRSNARAWATLKSMLHEAQRGAAFVEGVNERIEKVEQARADAAFLARRRDFREDVAYLAERFGGPYAEQGKSILASAKSVREDLEILRRQRELDGFEKRYQEQRDRVGRELRVLVAEVKRTRRELAARTGIAEKDLPRPEAPAPPGSFGTKPPPVVVE